ncbi:hypothetical protein DLAC_08037 [Tieghemostelium lacteum]|uniref:Uncharacterized protein n=1 Tax=Tieghemostelium lacteum TaxID=361077 RepID=A0A151ZB10_TIELA|nr:hypothetical protein DLAC_08037 [Tieghemostelium lacteum]|eukprot:KYQ91129.1 hypothetical protein DLAC_08037 [Tieghemostelium lacteum]
MDTCVGISIYKMKTGNGLTTGLTSQLTNVITSQITTANPSTTANPATSVQASGSTTTSSALTDSVTGLLSTAGTGMSTGLLTNGDITSIVTAAITTGGLTGGLLTGGLLGRDLEEVDMTEAAGETVVQYMCISPGCSSNCIAYEELPLDVCTRVGLEYVLYSVVSEMQLSTLSEETPTPSVTPSVTPTVTPSVNTNSTTGDATSTTGLTNSPESLKARSIESTTPKGYCQSYISQYSCLTEPVEVTEFRNNYCAKSYKINCTNDNYSHYQCADTECNQCSQLINKPLGLCIVDDTNKMGTQYKALLPKETVTPTPTPTDTIPTTTPTPTPDNIKSDGHISMQVTHIIFIILLLTLMALN